MALREHAGWVTSVFLQKGGDGNIISGRYMAHLITSLLNYFRLRVVCNLTIPAKYTHVHLRENRLPRGGAPKIKRSPRVVSPRNFAHACVYFARPTVAIAKIRDYSQSGFQQSDPKVLLRHCFLSTKVSFVSLWFQREKGMSFLEIGRLSAFISRDCRRRCGRCSVF